MPATIQFKTKLPPPRASASAHERYLLVRLTVNSVRDAGFVARERFIHQGTGEVSFGNILLIDLRAWDQKKYRLRGRDAPTLDLNERILRIQIDLKDIQSKQQMRYDAQRAPRPTTDSVKFEYLTGNAPAVQGDQFVYPPKFLSRKAKQVRPGKSSPLLAQNGLAHASLGPDTPIRQAMAAYLIELTLGKKATGQMKLATYNKRKAASDWLARYPLSMHIPVMSLTPYWVEKYHEWLLCQPSGNPRCKHRNERMSPGTATIYCSVVCELLTWLRKQHLIERNPVGAIGDLGLPGNPAKDVYFLEPIHIERLFTLEVPGRYKVTHWWFRLICLTGMDLPDAIRYASAKETYEARTPGGNPKIIIRREKNNSECNIPITSQLVDLWDEVIGEAPPAISDTTMINHLEKIAELIGFEKRLTPKIGRKTAGVIFLQDYSIKAVSNALGHSTIGVTERNYVKVTGHLVDKELDTLVRNRNETKSKPFF
jgi:hypothetical protein